jgi:hypothetical protein
LARYRRGVLFIKKRTEIREHVRLVRLRVFAEIKKRSVTPLVPVVGGLSLTVGG